MTNETVSVRQHERKINSLNSVGDSDDLAIFSSTTRNDDQNFPIIEIWKEEKNAERERVLPENFETKWNNADYKHEIEIYHAQKGFSILEVVRGLDRCRLISQHREPDLFPRLSTESLLQIGYKCGNNKSELYSQLYELAIERNKRIRICLNNSINKKLACNISERSRIGRVESGVNYRVERRCQETAHDSAMERKILRLTLSLTASNHQCLMRIMDDNGRNH
ncbi:unnamed protein product [Dracunculus medinensis]|uniref:Uncharacterized protein n=1 Tax=Dracunculus medinensis TaxID=318479 RepID=A0A0N4UPW7_DRAME|nr:unnamed protein product [Dracunculus medinensis]